MNVRQVFWKLYMPLTVLLTVAIWKVGEYFSWLPAAEFRGVVLQTREFLCHPEPHELLWYLVIGGVPTFCLGVFFYIFRNVPWGSHATISEQIWAYLGASFIGFNLVWQNKYVHVYWGRWQWLRAALIAWVIAVVIPKLRGPQLRAVCKTFFDHRWIANGFAAFLVVSVMFSGIFREENWNQTMLAVKDNLWFTMAEVSAVLDGRVPRVNFFPQYQALFGFAGLPFFKLFGFSILTFTVWMSLLSALGLVLVYLTLIHVTGSVWKGLALFVPFLALSAYPAYEYLDQRFGAYSYYAMSPDRYLGMWVAFWAWGNYLVRPTHAKQVLLAVLATLAWIGNLEFGFVSWFACVASDWVVKRSIKSSALILAYTIGTVGAYSFLIWMWSGEVPHWAETLEFQKAFGKFGFMSLAMPTWGLHWVMALTWLGGTGFAIQELWSTRNASKPNPLTGALLFSSLAGWGSFAYYIGRSHWESLQGLFGIWGLTLVLLFWKSDPLKPKILRGAIALGFGLMVSLVPAVPSAMEQGRRIFRVSPDAHLQLGDWVSAVREVTQEQELVYVVFPYSDLIARQAGVRNLFPFAQEESLILRTQLKPIEELLIKNHIKSVFGRLNPELRDLLSKHKFVRRLVMREGFEVWLKQ